MPDIWGVIAIIVKLMLYVGIASSTGLMIIRTVFPDLVSPLNRQIKRQAAFFAVLALVAAVFGFVLQGAALLGDAGGVTDPEMLGLLWQTPVGDALTYQVIGAVVIIAGLFIPYFGRWISLAGGILALWSLAQIGHVPQVEQTGARLLLLLHLLGVAFWIGILGPLRNLSRQPEHLDRAARLGHLFGRVASVTVPFLILAGLLMAWLLLGDLRSLVSTPYGLTLLVKLSLVVLILALAAANKHRFVPAMQAGDAEAARHLARSIELEALVIALVLMVTATLTTVLTLPG